MAWSGRRLSGWGWYWVVVVGVTASVFMASVVFSARTKEHGRGEASVMKRGEEEKEGSFLMDLYDSLWHKDGRLGYTHTWPLGFLIIGVGFLPGMSDPQAMEFGWRIIVGTIIGFLGAAFGSVGGVGGGGIFVPMLTLIIGFDAKSSTAISKCMIMGAAGASVYYNIKLRHPTLDLPIIDYDLALLFQPVLVLGISIGVAFNVIFADWMITVLLIVLFLATSTKAFFKGVETWKKETVMKKEAARMLERNRDGNEGEEYQPLPGGPRDETSENRETLKTEVPVLENVYWKEFGLLVAVWVIILALEISKNYTTTCSWAYWVLNLMQIPVALGVSGYEAYCLYTGKRDIASIGGSTDWKILQLLLYMSCGILAGIVGGLLGLGGGFILGPLFLELGVPPQVSSATATFAMTFSSSMSVVEYYLLKRFPVPYALYLLSVATIAALVGQHIVRRLITILGRASLIIFILAFTIFVSAISLGGVGIANMITNIENHEYMGFEDLCSSSS